MLLTDWRLRQKYLFPGVTDEFRILVEMFVGAEPITDVLVYLLVQVTLGRHRQPDKNCETRHRNQSIPHGHPSRQASAS